MPFNGPLLITVAGFFVFQVLEIGITDMMEHIFVNPAVHKIHNFPDILGIEYNPKDPWVNYYAFKSGVICAQILLLPLVIKLILLALTPKANARRSLRFYLQSHIILMVFLLLADILVLYTYDQDKISGVPHSLSIYIYRNHMWFYLTHTIAEISSLVCTIFMCCGWLPWLT
ncbi:hypothetical protein PFJ87_04g00880 [Encephalitozoon hellem]|uniref:Uncharacterized protein n=1 Tax=Encephalitozoon hellem TaxID=27973 RepID=A0ABY8CHR6_ENCHE|nr:hypothetical protein PFJ87_04g00880 [Encephalitozoon hellem]